MRLVTLDEVPGPDGQPLFVEFVNTLHWYEGAPIELLGTESELADWLVARRLPADDVAGCLPDVHRLREHVRGVTAALASRGALPAADMAALEAALSAPTGNLTLVDGALSAPTGNLTLVDGDSAHPRVGFATNAADAALFALQVALSVAGFLRSPQRHRLKLCANPTCGFAFVDTSTNATRRWCFMRYCGNRLKVRAFRRRRTPRRRASSTPR
jgi:predicted RNA-binding Zn ribbon-like protein